MADLPAAEPSPSVSIDAQYLSSETVVRPSVIDRTTLYSDDDGMELSVLSRDDILSSLEPPPPPKMGTTGPLTLPKAVNQSVISQHSPRDIEECHVCYSNKRNTRLECGHSVLCQVCVALTINPTSFLPDIPCLEFTSLTCNIPPPLAGLLR